MHDRARALLGEDPRQQPRIGNVALVEGDALGDRETEPRHQIVDHRHRPARITQGEHRVAADIAGPAGHEHGWFSRKHSPKLNHF